MQYANCQRSARSLEWQCLWSCMGTIAWCAADFRATQPRQLGAARSDFGPGTARRPPDRQEMQRHHARALCDHRRPCWQRSGRSCMASPEPLPLGPAAAANAPLPGMPSAPGRALCAAITAVLTYTTSELFVRLGTALAAAGGGVEAQRGPAVTRRPPRGCAAPGASASFVWRPGKSASDAHVLGGDPASSAAILAKASAHKRIGRRFSSLQDLLSQAQSEPLRSRLDPLDRE